MARLMQIRITENSQQTSPKPLHRLGKVPMVCPPTWADIVGTTGSTKAVFRVAGRAPPVFKMLPFVARHAKNDESSIFCDPIRHLPVHNQPACGTPPG
jgi:hypothetical protein